MTQLLVVFFLILAAGTVAISALGVLTMDNVFDRLHYLGPAGSVAPLAVAIAVLLDDGLSSAAVKSFLTAGFLLLIGPVASHATARAARVRQYGHPHPMPEEKRVDVRAVGSASAQNKGAVGSASAQNKGAVCSASARSKP